MNSKILRTAYRPRARTRRRAFSLVELVVALGILLLMLSLAGQVMNLTVKSTGQATALTEINQRLRTLEESLREDLRQVDPKRSVMVIVGNPVNAYWTRNGKEADDDGDPLTGYPNNFGAIYQTPVDATVPDPMYVPTPPRADVLMFFTSRKARNFVQYQYQDPELVGKPVTSNIQQVVYGHAVPGDWVPDTAGTTWEFDPRVDPQDAFPHLPEYNAAMPPAQEWHLARRSVLVVPTEAPAPVQNDPRKWTTYDGSVGTFGADDILRGISDVMAFPPPPVGTLTFEDVALKPNANPSGTLIGVGQPPLYWPAIFDNGLNPAARSQLDLDPPPLVADRLSAFFLPNCASFKVEWAFDPGSEAVGGRLDLESEVQWIDPGNTGEKLLDDNDDDPLAALEASLGEAEDASLTSNFQADRAIRLKDLLEGCVWGTSDPDWNGCPGGASGYTTKQRFQYDPAWPNSLNTGPRTNVHVFTASRGQDGLLPEGIFPKALRITVDLWDANGRLDRPVRHVMVIPVGGED
ncbi:MAG: prepilin-type N-terminal cleavage/methylation domain-containing protein [Phycisphaerae bacterium]|nr:prepilin-type N-terminal cleavage/methylation domain-containing protein [Phycisphaerae bacterium]